MNSDVQFCLTHLEEETKRLESKLIILLYFPYFSIFHYFLLWGFTVAFTVDNCNCKARAFLYSGLSGNNYRRWMIVDCIAGLSSVCVMITVASVLSRVQRIPCEYVNLLLGILRDNRELVCFRFQNDHRFVEAFEKVHFLNLLSIFSL